jgi:hypothetical protein
MTVKDGDGELGGAGQIWELRKIWVELNTVMQHPTIHALHSNAIEAHSGFLATYHHMKKLFSLPKNKGKYGDNSGQLYYYPTSQGGKSDLSLITTTPQGATQCLLLPWTSLKDYKYPLNFTSCSWWLINFVNIHMFFHLVILICLQPLPKPIWMECSNCKVYLWNWCRIGTMFSPVISRWGWET